MARETPWESSQPIWWVRNSLLRKAIQWVTADILNREVYIRWMSNEEKSMMEKAVLSWCLICWRKTSNPSWYCDKHL